MRIPGDPGWTGHNKSSLDRHAGCLKHRVVGKESIANRRVQAAWRKITMDLHCNEQGKHGNL
jgi:hypothetical protein